MALLWNCFQRNFKLNFVICHSVFIIKIVRLATQKIPLSDFDQLSPCIVSCSCFYILQGIFLIRIMYSFFQFGFDFIDVFRVKEFKFRPVNSVSDDSANSSQENDLSDNQNGELVQSKSSSVEGRNSRNRESVWNIDGELVEQANLHVK